MAYKIVDNVDKNGFLYYPQSYAQVIHNLGITFIHNISE